MVAREHFRFFQRFLSSPRTVSALAPSSSELADAMTDGIDWSSVRTVVEYGPGTGVFTQAISRRVKKGTRLIAVELDPSLANITARRVPSASVRVGSVADIEAICATEGISAVDTVVSGLPWSAFDPDQQVELLTATLRILRPHGSFVTFAYPYGLLFQSGRRFRRLLDREFALVQRTPIVWRNLPPAFVYRCRSAAAHRTAAPIASA